MKKNISKDSNSEYMVKKNMLKNIKKISNNNTILVRSLQNLKKEKENILLDLYNLDELKELLISKQSEIEIIADQKMNKIRYIVSDIMKANSKDDIKEIFNIILLNNSFYPKTEKIDKLKKVEQQIKDVLIFGNFGIINRTIINNFPKYMLDDTITLNFLGQFINSLYRFDESQNVKLNTFVTGRLRTLVKKTFNNYKQVMYDKNKNLFIKNDFLMKEFKDVDVMNLLEKYNISYLLSEELILKLHTKPEYINHILNGFINNKSYVEISGKKYDIKEFNEVFNVNILNHFNEEDFNTLQNISPSIYIQRYLMIKKLFLNIDFNGVDINKKNKDMKYKNYDEMTNVLAKDDEKTYEIEDNIINEKEYEYNSKLLSVKAIYSNIINLNLDYFYELELNKENSIKIKQNILNAYRNEESIEEEIYNIFEIVTSELKIFKEEDLILKLVNKEKIRKDDMKYIEKLIKLENNNKVNFNKMTSKIIKSI